MEGIKGGKMQDYSYIKDEKLKQKLYEFDNIVDKMRSIIIAKNNDYGNANIGDLGIKGLFVRLWDKVNRLKQLVWVEKENQVKDESIEDTYLDLANYAVISIIVKRGKWN